MTAYEKNCWQGEIASYRHMLRMNADAIFHTRTSIAYYLRRRDEWSIATAGSQIRKLFDLCDRREYIKDVLNNLLQLA